YDLAGRDEALAALARRVESLDRPLMTHCLHDLGPPWLGGAPVAPIEPSLAVAPRYVNASTCRCAGPTVDWRTACSPRVQEGTRDGPRYGRPRRFAGDGDASAGAARPSARRRQLPA